MTTKFVESHCIEQSAVPVDTTGAAVTGDRFNLAKYGKITWIINQGAWAGGTPAVTLQQHDAASSGNSKAISFTEYWSKVGLTGTVFAKTAVSNDTFNLTATANTITVIEVDTEKLDTANGYVYASLNIATPGANADLIQVTAILSDPRYQGDPAVELANPKV